jgi:hypothetical protein
MTIQALEPVVELMATEKNLSSLTDSVKVLQEQIKGILPQYNAANYNEDNIADAKADRALLNKLAKAVNDKKIAFKKEFLKPLEEFEGCVGDTVKLIETVSQAIDKVVKDQEAKERQARQAVIDELWEGMKFDLVPLAKIQKPSWLNKATTKKTIMAEMAETVSNIKSNVGLLSKVTHPDDLNAIKGIYLDDLDFHKAAERAQKLKIERENQVIRQAAIEKAAKEAPVPTPPDPPETYQDKIRKDHEAAVDVAPVTYTRAFKVTGTKEQIIALGDFMVAKGIKFEKLPV